MTTDGPCHTEPTTPCRSGAFDVAAYDALRHLAASRLARIPKGPTFQPTDVLHEAYVRLLEARGPGGEPLTMNLGDAERTSRDVLLYAAAIRSVLVDRVRRREVRRRHAPRVAATREERPARHSHVSSLLALDESLEVLARIDERAARLVELHVFAGLTLANAASLLGVSGPTAERDWRFAKAWLADRLEARTAEGALPRNREGPGLPPA